MDEKGLGARLQEVRREKGLTQQELCQKANLSYSTLAKIERGAIKSPSIFTIQSIAGVLGVTLDELLGRVGTVRRSLKRTKSGVRFVYFDVNGCLIQGYQRAFISLAQTTGVAPDVIETVFWRYNDETNRGTISMSDFNAALSQRVGATVNWAEAYLAAVEPVAGMQQAVQAAAEQYEVGIITNSMPGLISRLREGRVLPAVNFSAIIDSSEIGAIKPESKMYDVAAEKAGLPPAEILLIDDDRANIVGAEKAGWHVLLFDAARPDESLERIQAALEPAD